jgi:hypothetical protein
MVLRPDACRNEILQYGDRDARHADAEVLIEAGILGRDDCVAEHRRDLVVADDQPPLGRELTNRLSVSATMRVIVFGR